MELPTRITTKRDALALAAEVFPEYKDALTEAKRSNPTPPEKCDATFWWFYWITYKAKDDLRLLFEWLYNDKTRIYQRPRWHLFCHLASRVVELVDKARQDIESEWQRTLSDRKWNKRQRANLVTGDGEGI